MMTPAGQISLPFGKPRTVEDQRRIYENCVGPSHHSAPETSRQAAEANAPRSGTQRAKVLLALFGARSRHLGLTDDQIAAETGLVGNAVRPRRGELVADGFVEDSGERRSSWMGHPAVVWTITARGALVARELDR